MRLFILTAMALLLAQATSALAQQTTFQGTAVIEDISAPCGGDQFPLARPSAATFKPANVGSNSATTFFSFSTNGEIAKSSVAAISLRVTGTPAANSTYDAVEIRGDGTNNTFSGILHAVQLKPATITPTTSLVEVFMVLKNVRGITGCNLRVRAGLVYW